MQRANAAGERAIGLFLLALLAFNPPILWIFSADRLVLGVPLLYLYLFLAWAVVIVMLALQARAKAARVFGGPEAGGRVGGRPEG